MVKDLLKLLAKTKCFDLQFIQGCKTTGARFPQITG
jgi:hypothetical protein